MGRNEEAIAAYKAGLEASPGNSMLLERLREATRPAAPVPVPPRPSPPTGAAASSAFASKYGATLAPAIDAARVFLLLAFVASLVLPMLLGEEAGGRAHSLVLGVAAALHGLQLFMAHGIPQFNAEWITRLLEGAPACSCCCPPARASPCSSLPASAPPPPPPSRPPAAPRLPATCLPALPPAVSRCRRRVPGGLALCAGLCAQGRSWGG